MFKIFDQKPPSYNSLFAKNSRTNAQASIITNNKQTDTITGTATTTTIIGTTTGAIELNPIQDQQLQEPISYDSFMKARKHLVQDQQQLSQHGTQQHNQSNGKYLPVKYTILHCVALSALSFILIGFQIILIIKNAPFNYIGAGIWVGIYNLIIVALSLVTIKHQKKSLILIVENMNIIGCIISLGAIIGLNLIIIMNSTTASCTKTSCFTTNDTISSSGNGSDLSSVHLSDININILFLVIGAICVVLHVTYFILIECKIKSTMLHNRQVFPVTDDET